MRKLTLLFVFVSSIAYGQNLINTQTVGQAVRNQRVGNGLQVEDTTLLKGQIWLPNLSTLGGATDSILSIDPSTNLVELRPQATFDTTGIYAALNLKVDSVKRIAGTDSVYYYTNGTPHFAFIDSTGSSIAVSDSAWMLLGNSGTSPTTNFVGTADSVDLAFRTGDIRWWTMKTLGQLWGGAGYDTVRDGGVFLPVVTRNISIGDSSMTALVYSSDDTLTSHSNIAIGFGTLESLVKGVQNIAIGHGTMRKLNGSYSGGDFFTGGAYENVAVGNNIMKDATTADENSAFGTGALGNCIDCITNTAIGLSALGKLTTAGSNVAVGSLALGALLADNQNTAVGNNAGGSATGGQNTFVGYNAGKNITAGSFNTAIGEEAHLNGGGIANTVVGALAALNQTITAGIFIGQGAGKNGGLSNYDGIIDSRFRANAHKDTTQSAFYFRSGSDSLDTFIRMNGRVGINDGTNVPGYGFVCKTVHGYGFWQQQDGEYTPTTTITTNIDSVSVLGAQWHRNDSTVTVSGVYVVDADSVGIVEFEMELPISSNFTQIYQLGGTAFDIESQPGDIPEGAGIYADIADDRASVRSYSSHVDIHKHSFHFTYRIK